MKSSFLSATAIPVFALLASGCGGHGRALVVKSSPADADVCIKGKANSEHFSNQKSCVGSTPFEATKVLVTDPDGKRKEVKFSDIEGDHESFYVVVSRNGYLSEVMEVPDKTGQWEFDVSMKSEQAAAAAQVAAVSAAAPAPLPVAPARPAVQQPSAIDNGTLRITSDPAGALVYIGGALRGNTPFTYEARGGENVAIKLELDGYKTVEKSFTMEAQKNFAINFRLPQNGVAPAAAPAAPVITPVPGPAAAVPAKK